jgi:hypothetical protein
VTCLSDHASFAGSFVRFDLIMREFSESCKESISFELQMTNDAVNMGHNGHKGRPVGRPDAFCFG